MVFWSAYFSYFGDALFPVLLSLQVRETDGSACHPLTPPTPMLWPRNSCKLGGEVITLTPFVSYHSGTALLLCWWAKPFKLFGSIFCSGVSTVAGVNINQVLVIPSLPFFLYIYFQFWIKCNLFLFSQLNGLKVHSSREKQVK